MRSVDLLINFVEEPEGAALAASRDRPLALGTLCFTVAAVSLSLAQAISGRATFLPFGLASVAASCLWQIISSFFLVSILHLIVEFVLDVESHGNAAGLWVLFGVSELVMALTLPIALILRAFSIDHSWVMPGVTVILIIAHILLKARSIRDNYGISGARAIFILFIPYLFLVIFVFAVVAAAVIGMLFSLVQVIT